MFKYRIEMEVTVPYDCSIPGEGGLDSSELVEIIQSPIFNWPNLITKGSKLDFGDDKVFFLGELPEEHIMRKGFTNLRAYIKVREKQDSKEEAEERMEKELSKYSFLKDLDTLLSYE
jgi:hypothetical protein